MTRFDIKKGNKMKNNLEIISYSNTGKLNGKFKERDLKIEYSSLELKLEKEDFKETGVYSETITDGAILVKYNSTEIVFEINYSDRDKEKCTLPILFFTEDFLLGKKDVGQVPVLLKYTNGLKIILNTFYSTMNIDDSIGVIKLENKINDTLEMNNKRLADFYTNEYQ